MEIINEANVGVPDCSDCQGKSSEGMYGPVSSTRSFEHLLWHRMASAAGPKPPRTLSRMYNIHALTFLESYLVNTHIPQKSLFMFSRLQTSSKTGLDTHSVHSVENLLDGLVVSGLQMQNCQAEIWTELRNFASIIINTIIHASS